MDADYKSIKNALEGEALEINAAIRERRIKVDGDKKEMVNHPDHYNTGKIEVINAIEDWGLGFSLGNAVKYIARADHKGKRKEDLKKALWYIQREIERSE